MPVLETPRLSLHRFTLNDSEFAFQLVNDPDFIKFIGDKGVRTLEDARNYLLNGPIASYDRHGFGLLKVVRKADAQPIGMCGLLKRDTLEDVDLGYAFLPAFRSQGFASEAAAGVVDYGRQAHRLSRIVAITDPKNARSIHVLERAGFRLERTVQMAADAQPLALFGRAV